MFNDKNPYTIRFENIDDVRHYFVSFIDGENKFREIEVSHTIFSEINHSIKTIRNLTRSDERHIENIEQNEESLYSKALNYQKGVEDVLIGIELINTLRNAIADLPEIQRRRFTLYYEFGLTFEQIAKMDGCSIRAIKFSVDIAKEKINKFFEE